MKPKYNGESLKFKLSRKERKTLKLVIARGFCGPDHAPCDKCPLRVFFACDDIVALLHAEAKD